MPIESIDMEFPMMVKVHQELVSYCLDDPVRELADGIAGIGPRQHFRGPRVAVAVGSRHIDGIASVVRGAVGILRESGCEPFILPAMGSHGGGTESGQAKVLETLGITEEAVGAPLRTSMETVKVGTGPGGADVFASRECLEADGIVAINRVGLHTGFTGTVQSGLVKMLAVGLGKVEGAKAIHERGFGAGHLIGEAADIFLAAAPPVIGIALVEDGTKKVCELEVLRGEEIRAREPVLLETAASMWPRIPVREADLLIVDEIGKDISGIGMDPLVTGRGKEMPAGLKQWFHAERIVVLRLTEASGGNATGIGHADITTQAFHDAMDRVVTYKNVLTSGALHRARMPLVADTDRDAVEMALVSLGGLSPEKARVVRIKNTRELADLEVSEALVPLLEGEGAMSVEHGSSRLSFGSDGRIGGGEE
jgi:hypothetical protein